VELSAPISDDQHPLYSIVIPAHNEEHNVSPTVLSLIDVLRAEHIAFEIVIVDDASDDNTVKVVESLMATVPEIRLIRKGAPTGLGRAIRVGLENIQGTVVGVVMADLSDSPADVVRCYRLIEEGYDCVFGSRFMPGGQVIHYPLVKRFFNRAANWTMQLLFLTRHDDLTNAFKVYRREVIESISPLRAAHFNITIEMSLSALIRHYKIARIPISWSGRTWGQSNLRVSQMGRRYLCTMLKLWFERLLILDDLMADREKP
jgi:dolichol-phosphate mannosyltransferase